MLRFIVAVIVSFIAIFGLITAVFAGLWYGLGPDGLLQPGTFKGNMLFAVSVPATTIVTGLLGGWMCAKIGRGAKPVMVLAALTLLLGIAVCYGTFQKPEPTGVREPGITMDQYMDRGREPMWLAIFNPIARAVTVLIGGLWIAAPRKAHSAVH